MDTGASLGPLKLNLSEELPSVFQCLQTKSLAGFDDVEVGCVPSPDIAVTSCRSHEDASQTYKVHHTRSTSVSLPSSPVAVKRVLFSDQNGGTSNSELPSSLKSPSSKKTKLPKQSKFHSQPIPSGNAYADAMMNGNISNSLELPRTISRTDRLKDRRYDSFKTWSGKMERQISNLRGKQQGPVPENNDSPNSEIQSVPVERYFDALEGPELETLRASEELLLPEDKRWPFLLRFPVSSFGICLGVSSQAILWKAIATSPSTSFLHVSLDANLVLWCISIALVVMVFLIYSLKFIFYFEAVRREYYHPIRVNFFFAPWIALLFLALGVPPTIAKYLHATLWYVLMAPILCLELKIYGQWMSGGQRRLSKVANPSNHLSVVGNFVGALLGASMGLKEGPIFFFAVGLAHYSVLFVTLYQRLPTNETLPKELHPVFFLFVAAPSVASMAWAKIQGTFDYGSRISYFIALFLYFSLAVRVNFFRGFRFSLAWWAYTFPMTGASIATIKYSNEVTNTITRSLSLLLSLASTLTVTALLISTIIHAFVLRDLFPNDIAIAISRRKKKTNVKHFHLFRHGSSDTTDNSQAMRSETSDVKDIELALKAEHSTCKVDIESSLSNHPDRVW
ncbi:hypothetical protein Sjap_005081 [Stephania japonica]|uniref:S-type anion channel SLAH2-like n=1 Tax=Stephania japonica TaxID=461633 RepID=A0AAP0PHJ3_9MAGN